MSPEQLVDALDCGVPEQAWTALLALLEGRARASEDTALSLERDAKDAVEQANEFHQAAQDFHNLAEALRRAPVAFASQPSQEQS